MKHEADMPPHINRQLQSLVGFVKARSSSIPSPTWQPIGLPAVRILVFRPNPRKIGAGDTNVSKETMLVS